MLSPVFADSDGWLQVAGYIATAVGSAVGAGGLWKLLDWWSKRKTEATEAEARRHEQERKDKAEDDETTLRHYDDLFKRMKTDREEDKERMRELEAENAELRRRVGRTEVRLGRAEERIRHLEALCRQANLPYPVWQDETPVELHGPPVGGEP